ncbi:aquaporin-like protein [Tribonema minus]|uniref:Aquaporin-like protein n=1 Tax=Tribonema minus TaxID=303371 RepID=A0A835Z3D0_9STRA|nr:aquaporin-like protein [Tribonema minus]
MSVGGRLSRTSRQDGPGITFATSEDSPTTFYETRQAGFVLKRRWQFGVVLVEKASMAAFDSYFWRAVLVEGLGMLVFLFAVCTLLSSTSAANFDGGTQQILIAMIFGLVLFVLVYLTATLSGGNLNPAVTAALVMGKRISLVRGLCYIVSQIICTALLCTTVLVGLSNELWELMPKAKVHLLLPMAVGSAVAVAHLIMVPIDGTSINPARSFGPAAVAGQWSSHACFWVGPLLGALVSVILWEAVLRPPQAMRIDGATSSNSVQLEEGHDTSSSSAQHGKPGFIAQLRQHARGPHG